MTTGNMFTGLKMYYEQVRCDWLSKHLHAICCGSCNFLSKRVLKETARALRLTTYSSSYSVEITIRCCCVRSPYDAL